MKNLYCCFAFLLLAGLVSGQASRISWVGPYEKPQALLPPTVLYADDNYTYLVYPAGGSKTSGLLAHFVKLSREGKEIFNKPVQAKGEWIYFITAVYNKGKFGFAYHMQLTKEHVSRVQTLFFDEDGNVTGEPVTIYEEQFPKKWSRIGTIESALSPDHSKLAIRFFYSPALCEVLVVDMAMQVLWRDSVACGREEFYFPTRYPADYPEAAKPQRFCVSNEGELFMLRHFNADTGRVPELIRFSKNSHTSVPVKACGWSVSEPLVCMDNEGNMVLAGLCWNRGEHRYDAAVTLCWPAGAASPGKPVYKDFNEETLQALDLAAQESRYDHSVNISFPGKSRLSSVVRPACMLAAGKYVYYINEVYIGDWNQGRTSLNFKDNFVTIIKPGGEIETTMAVTKNQVACPNAKIGSFCAFSDGDNLKLLFNDKRTNLDADDRSKADPFYFWRHTVGMLVTVNPKAQMKREVLFDNKDLDGVMEPATLSQVNPHLSFVLSLYIAYTSQADGRYFVGRIESSGQTSGH